jgi:hypothetical protein
MEANPDVRVHLGPLATHTRTARIISKNIKFSWCLTNHALDPEDVWGSGCMDPGILDISTGWRPVISFTPLPLSSMGQDPTVLINSRLGRSQNRSERHGEERILNLPGLEICTLGLSVCIQSIY